ncbi:9499_t:CDS:2 [Acaulospora morrowiae]|uniref:Methionine synthase reductase n=1 Tax=Acaulospora morrowiae TaxID=94023 RepID=A0A9N9A5G3_9GLOM|nr:9499_t:CDS:2 [Acaulospora morrowiae]
MTTEKSENLVVFYASQTGNAEWIAKNIHQEALKRGFSSEYLVFDEHDKVELSKEKILIFVTSSTGDGDPPDNATKFFRYLRKVKSKTFLSHAKFTILGLADDALGLETVVDPWIENLWATLANVCVQKQGHNIDAEEIIDSVKTLSVNSITKTVQESPDIQTTNGKSNGQLSGNLSGVKVVLDFSEFDDTSQLTALPRIPVSCCKIVKSRKENFVSGSSLPSFIVTPTPIINSRLSFVRCLTHPGSVKKTLHMELDVKEYGKKIQFSPGDAFGILAPNDDILVRDVLTALGIDENEAKQEISVEPVEGTELPTHLKQAKSTSIIELLRYAVDLTSLPRKALLRMMAEYASNSLERKKLLFLCSKQGIQQFNRLREQIPTILDLLVTFPSCKPPIERLLDALPPHKPRYYSIVNSPLLNSDALHFAFNVVDYHTPDPYNVHRLGVCTSWLNKLSGNITEEGRSLAPLMIDIPIFMEINTRSFTIPPDISKPLIMIGPGTGVAPFVGFLNHRELQMKNLSEYSEQFGEMWLFYGCRKKEKDFLYRQELEGFLKQGILKELLVVESRAPGAGLNGKPKYVQDLLRNRGSEIFKLMSQNEAMIFVCGDAKGMAKDVNESLADILVEHGKIERSDALKLLIRWMEERRYLRDLVVGLNDPNKDGNYAGYQLTRITFKKWKNNQVQDDHNRPLPSFRMHSSRHLLKRRT